MGARPLPAHSSERNVPSSSDFLRERRRCMCDVAAIMGRPEDRPRPSHSEALGHRPEAVGQGRLGPGVLAQGCCMERPWETRNTSGLTDTRQVPAGLMPANPGDWAAQRLEDAP